MTEQCLFVVILCLLVVTLYLSRVILCIFFLLFCVSLQSFLCRCASICRFLCLFVVIFLSLWTSEQEILSLHAEYLTRGPGPVPQQLFCHRSNRSFLLILWCWHLKKHRICAKETFAAAVWTLIRCYFYASFYSLLLLLLLSTLILVSVCSLALNYAWTVAMFST